MEKYRVKYAKVATSLTKDQGALLTSHNLSVEHRDFGRNVSLAYLRTSNLIESVFATIRHQTVRTNCASSQDTVRLIVFKLAMAATKIWHRLKSENRLAKVIQGVTFRNGVEVIDTPTQNTA